MEHLEIFIFNHGHFGEELIKSAEMIVGKIDNIHSHSLLPGMSIEEFYELSEKSLQKYDGKKIVLCDLYGGTPSNVALMLSEKYNLEIICGVNLGMLIDLVLTSDHSDDLEQICKSAYEAGLKSIIIPEKLKRDVE